MTTRQGIQRKKRRSYWRVYGFICDFCREHNGTMPTVRQIMNGLNYGTTSTVHMHIRKLEEDGFLERVGNRWKVVGAMWVPPKEAEQMRLVLDMARTLNNHKQKRAFVAENDAILKR